MLRLCKRPEPLAGFSHDSLNRIATAKTSATSGSNCWGETYTVDQWANLTAIGAVSGYTGCTQESLSVTATTNNQLSATGFSYDAAGNMLGDSVNTYGWNAESEIKSAAGVNYIYDGDGNRVQKSNGKIYWYGAGTEILDESDASGNITDEYVFFGGKRVAHRVVSSGAISYYAEDFLGSSRAIATSAGTLCYDADFYPYGGERVVTNTCAQNYKFEGKERDTETGNDDFGARYYTSKLGRWLSADWSAIPEPVPYANLTNPQTLNLYAMVSDNPETFADLDGHLGGLGEPIVEPTGVCKDTTVCQLIDKAEQTIDSGVQYLKDVGAGATNELISSAAFAANFLLGPTIGTPDLSPQNDAQQLGAHLTDIALVAIPGAGEEAEASSIIVNAERGAASEARVLNDLGMSKNTEAVVGTEGRSIPDFQTKTTVGEIKDAKTVSNTKQLRIQKEAAQASGRKHELHTGTKTHVTPKAVEGTNVTRRKDLGP